MDTPTFERWCMLLQSEFLYADGYQGTKRKAYRGALESFKVAGRDGELYSRYGGIAELFSETDPTSADDEIDESKPIKPCFQERRDSKIAEAPSHLKVSLAFSSYFRALRGEEGGNEAESGLFTRLAEALVIPTPQECSDLEMAEIERPTTSALREYGDSKIAEVHKTMPLVRVVEVKDGEEDETSSIGLNELPNEVDEPKNQHVTPALREYRNSKIAENKDRT